MSALWHCCMKETTVVCISHFSSHFFSRLESEDGLCLNLSQKQSLIKSWNLNVTIWGLLKLSCFVQLYYFNCSLLAYLNTHLQTWKSQFCFWTECLIYSPKIWEFYFSSTFNKCFLSLSLKSLFRRLKENI